MFLESNNLISMTVMMVLQLIFLLTFVFQNEFSFLVLLRRALCNYEELFFNASNGEKNKWKQNWELPNQNLSQTLLLRVVALYLSLYLCSCLVKKAPESLFIDRSVIFNSFFTCEHPALSIFLSRKLPWASFLTK